MLEARLAALGIDLSVPARIVIFFPSATLRRGRAALALASTRALLEETLAARRIPYLLAERDARLIAFIQDSCAEIDEWLAHISRDSVRFAAGIGRSVSSIEDLRESLLDAELAATQLRHEHGPRSALFFEEFDLASWLISTAMSSRLAGKVENMLGPLKANDLCWQALVAYFDAHLDITQAARSLHLHPNSVRYRLNKAANLLGQPIGAPATLVNLYLALAIDRAGDQTTRDQHPAPSAART
jgi:sugar diacid utilization regulator